MSTTYDPAYTDLEEVMALTQVTIDESSVPTAAQTLRWIRNAESRLIDRALGSHTATDQYIDVPAGSSVLRRYQWVYYVKDDRLVTSINRGTVVPLQGLKSPIISISACAKNDEDPTNAASWDTLTEGPGADSDFILLQSGLRDVGYALWFYDNEPMVGPKRLKMTYQYGRNVNSNILTEWATYATGVTVLQARKNSNQVSGMASYDGGDLGDYIPRHYNELIASYRASMLQLEYDHFIVPRSAAFEVV